MCVISSQLRLKTTVIMAQVLCIMAFNVRLQKRYTKVDVCATSTTTLQIVQSCPRDIEAMQKRSEIKMCQVFDSCNGEHLVYHCVRYNNTLAEVCAPKGLITGGCCAEFNKGVGRVVEDYNTICTECPINYESNKSSMYSTCVEPPQSCKKHEKRGKRHAECDYQPETTSVVPNTKIFNESTEINGKSSKGSTENSALTYIAVSVLVLAVLLGSVLTLTCLRRRLRFTKEDEKSGEPEERNKMLNTPQFQPNIRDTSGYINGDHGETHVSPNGDNRAK